MNYNDHVDHGSGDSSDDDFAPFYTGRYGDALVQCTVPTMFEHEDAGVMKMAEFFDWNTYKLAQVTVNM